VGALQKNAAGEEQQGEEEISRGKDIRGFKEKHRALDEQYQRLHDERV
jgi:hypothetical protein